MPEVKPATWADVERQFWFHDGAPEQNINRIAAYSAHLFGLTAPKLTADTARVTAEYWTSRRLWAAIKRLADRWDAAAPPDDRYVTAEGPRHEGEAVTVLRLGGESLILDGRRRINRWRGSPGRHLVLVIEPK